MSKRSGLSWTWSASGCEVRLSLCLYLQMHTFERTGSLLLWQSNWCCHQHCDKTMQSAACIEFDLFTVHYRYVCTSWRPWMYIVFLKSMCIIFPHVHHWSQRTTTAPYCEPVQFSSYLHKLFFNPPLYSMLQSNTDPSLSSSIFLRICAVTAVLPSVSTVYFYWPSSINFPMQNLIRRSFVVIFFYNFEYLPICFIAETVTAHFSVIPM